VSVQDQKGHEKILGQLSLSKFRNPGRLEPVDSRCFSPTPLSGKAVDFPPGPSNFGQIKQRTLEQSNVDSTEIQKEIDRLFQLKQLYEFCSSF